MNADLAIVLALLALAIVMFAAGRPRMDAVALLMLTVLPFTGVLTMNEALAGFADGNVVLIATLFIIGEGLVRTGVARRMGDLLIAKAGKSDRRLVILLMLFVGALGAVMSSTGVVAIFIPIVMRVAATIDTPPSGLMMPLSVAALSSGMLSLIATAPNLVVNAELVRQGAAGFHFFSVTPIGLPILLVSIAYMLAVRWRLQVGPARIGRTTAGPGLQDWMAKYELGDREMRLLVSEESPLVGRTLESMNLRETYGVDVLAFERPQQRAFEIVRPTRTSQRSFEVRRPTATTPFQPGDILLVDRFDAEGDVHALVRDLSLTRLPLTDSVFLDRSHDLGMAEVLVGPESPLVARTVREARIRRDYGLTVLGFRRGTTARSYGHLDESLRVGDALLVFGSWKQIDALKYKPDDLVLLSMPAERGDVLPAVRRAPQALAVLALVVVLMVTGAVPNVQAGLIGVLLLVALGCVDFTSAYGSIHWQSLVLIVGMMPFSLALQRTGGVDLAAGGLAMITHAVGSYGLLAALFLVTAVLGLFVSNTATAVLMAPVALAVAKELGASPYPFAMVVALAASAAYMTPVSSPVNTLVVEPGNYTFFDFVKIGVPLTAIVMVITVVLVPFFFPF
jgi:di/tricarboxylate transporter